jgi:LPS O-antigen subunit length determinant protein (WzzB/FepE family)
MQPTEERSYNLLVELSKVWLYRWLIIGLTLGGALSGFAYSIIMPTEYLSTSSLIPPSLKQIKSLNFLKQKFEGFGSAEAEDLERVSAALKSDTAYFHMVQKFDLIKHYGIQHIADEPTRQKRLRSIFEEKVAVTISDLSTIQIKVYDTDPNTAAKMSNEYLSYANNFVENIARRQEGISALENSIRDMERELKRVMDTAAYYRGRYRLYHLDNMSEAISQQIAAKAFNDPGFSQHYDKVTSAEHRMNYYDDNLSGMLNELVFRKENIKTYPVLIDIVSRGMPSKVRARPKRTLNIAVGLILGLFGSLVYVFYFGRRTFDADSNNSSEHSTQPYQPVKEKAKAIQT